MRGQSVRESTICENRPADRPVHEWKARVLRNREELFLAKVTLLSKGDQFGHTQLSQFGTTDPFHLRTGWSRSQPVPTDDKRSELFKFLRGKNHTYLLSGLAILTSLVTAGEQSPGSDASRYASSTRNKSVWYGLDNKSHKNKVRLLKTKTSMFPSKTLAYSDSADDKNEPLCNVM